VSLLCQIQIFSQERQAESYGQDAALESTLGRTLLKFATERGYRAKTPGYRFKWKVHCVWSVFSANEILHLLQTIETWIEDCRNDQWHYSRILLRNYVQVLINSGRWTDEVNNLRRRDIAPFTDESGRLNHQFLVRGKIGERE
jgi:integrase